MTSPEIALAQLWRWAGCDPFALERVRFHGGDPVLPGVFQIATAAQVSIAAAGLAAAELWKLRTGREQIVDVEARAAAASFRAERYLRIDGKGGDDPWGPASGYFRAGDGRWIQLHCNFPHHRDRALAVLRCEGTREAVIAAVEGWKAAELEEALVNARMCAGLLRTPEEWQAHPQALALAMLLPLEIIRIGEAPPEPLPEGPRPLSGIRALDLTHVIAGPVCGRTLAEHGAEVLRVTAPGWPSMERLVQDMGRGKLSTYLDLHKDADAERLRALAREADVFSQGYRPGTFAAHGFAPQDLARLRPGIIYVSLSAFGHEGPWRDRRGFDSIVQTVSGIAAEGGRVRGLDEPRPLPCQALDHASGYLLAFGAMVALARRATQGGSWLVRLSLAQTGRWLDRLGRVNGLALDDLRADAVADLMEETDTPWGRMKAVAPVAQLSETPGRFARPSTPLGAHPPEWPARGA
jgi:crotonobetainyl-CoA:carnitine CoA-transferase CaiB-like acyl-CoA transferase